MGWVWNPLGLLGVLAFTFTWGLGALVYASAPARATNRRLAALLLVEGGAALTGGGLLYLVTTEATASVFQTISTTLQLLLPALYLHFLATLETPLVRPLKSRAGQVALVGAGLASLAIFVRWPERFIEGMEPTWYAAWEGVPGPLSLALALVMFLVAIFGLAASLSTFRRAPKGTAARERAKAYAIAFGVRDALIALAILAPGTLQGAFPGRGWDLSGAVAVTLVFVIYTPLIAYAILRHQLFDIDVRLKWTIKQSTVAAVFVGAVLLSVQAAETFLNRRYGLALGGTAIVLLLLALNPLQRAGERVAGALLPGVDARDDAYVLRRKLDVYRAALEQSIGTGNPNAPEEQRALALLRERLGISTREHDILEYALRATLRGEGSAPARAAEAGADFQTGAVVLNKYRVERVLGQGGAGKTFLAQDTILGREVVIKTLHAHGRDEAALREARRIAAIRHPNVVILYDVEQSGARAFLVMEHVDGGSLADRVRAGPLALPEFARVARSLLDALAAVHDAGIVHRDVKPSNVLLTRGGEVKLADFGIAQLTAADDGTRDERTAAQGLAVGTLRYMSPEQAKGRRVSARSDVYSATATLFEALTGAPYVAPVPNETTTELQLRVAAALPFDREVPGPPGLREWFAVGLHPEATARFASARDMREALSEALAARAA